MKWTAEMINNLEVGQKITFYHSFMGRSTMEVAEVSYRNTNLQGKRFVGLRLFLGAVFASSTKISAKICEGDLAYDN